MYRTILVPLDGSPFGEHALPLAVSLAKRAGASLDLMHVMAPFASIYAEGPLFLDDNLVEHIKERERKKQQEYLEEVAGRVRAAVPLTVVTHLPEGDIPGQLCEQAAVENADLIVMTTHGRGPIARFWFGSITDELVRKAPCPLLLVHPSEGPADLTRDAAPHHLLLTLDGTPAAEQILEPAAKLAKMAGAHVTLVRVVRPVLTAGYPVMDGSFVEMAGAMAEQIQLMQRQIKQEAADYLDRMAAGLAAQGLEVATRVDVEEQPAAAILHDAAECGADLVALETHGRRGLGRLIRGSVADKVIRAAPVPVLVHHPVTA